MFRGEDSLSPAPSGSDLTWPWGWKPLGNSGPEEVSVSSSKCGSLASPVALPIFGTIVLLTGQEECVTRLLTQDPCSRRWMRKVGREPNGTSHRASSEWAVNQGNFGTHSQAGGQAEPVSSLLGYTSRTQCAHKLLHHLRSLIMQLSGQYRASVSLVAVDRIV